MTYDKNLEEAIRRINVANKESNFSLDLTALELTTIPKEILKLTHLSSLDLSNNNIEDISILSHLTTLTYLDIDHNQVRDISSLSTLIHLTTFNFNCNRIKDTSVISKFKKLTDSTTFSKNSNDIFTFVLSLVIGSIWYFVFHLPLFLLMLFIGIIVIITIMITSIVQGILSQRALKSKQIEEKKMLETTEVEG